MNRSRHAILVSLLAVLALLCGLAGTASAAFNTAAKNPHFGEFLLQKSEVSASDWLQPADTASGNGAWICDSTLGVPAYVRQNPWTFFDPEGLRTEGGIPDNPDEAEEDRDSYSELDKKIDRTIDDLGKLKKTGPGTGRASASAYFVKAYKLRQSLKEMSAQAAAIYSKLAVYEELNVAGYLMGRRARASADRFIMGDDTFRAFYPEYAGPRDAGIHDFSEEAFAITTLFTSPTSLRVLNSRAAPRTTLYRAVSPAELSDIGANAGALRNPLGIEVKYFSETAEGAASYARQAYQAGGRLYEGPYTIIKTDVASDLVTPIMRAAPDGGIPTITLPTEILPRLTPAQPLPFTPLPGAP